MRETPATSNKMGPRRLNSPIGRCYLRPRTAFLDVMAAISAAIKE
jgi:hypothetical protein